MVNKSKRKTEIYRKIYLTSLKKMVLVLLVAQSAIVDLQKQSLNSQI